MADIASQFFSPWDPPPPFAAEPADKKKSEVVQKLAQFAVKNGASFVELIKTKQQDNPEYRFLFGGENADYYLWVLYCNLHNLPWDQPLPAPQQPDAPMPQLPVQQQQQQLAPTQDVEAMLQQTVATCPVEVKTGFGQVLSGLTGSKDSIKQSQQWFMACLPHAAGMAAALALHVRSLPDYDKQLHVLYLTNDILLKRLSQRAPGSAADADDVAQAFKPWLPGILGMAYSTGGRTDQVKERLQKILSFWGDRKLYDKDVMQQLEAALLSGDPNATLQPPGPRPGAKPARKKWDQPAAPPAATAAPPAATHPPQSVAQPSQPYAQSIGSMPMHSSYMVHGEHMQATQPQTYPQPGHPQHAGPPQQPYLDPSMQQPGAQSYQQPYQQQAHQQQTPGMPNVPSGSMGMQSNPWQQPPASQQQPWGMHMPPQQGYGQFPEQQHQYPHANMGMYNSQLPTSGAMPTQQQQQQYMYPQTQLASPMMPQHQGMQSYGMQQGMQQPGGQWYPPPGVGGLPPGLPVPPLQAMPMQPPPGTHFGPPDVAPPPQQPAHPKADPMSFPPGLIPQLVSEKLKTDPPYSPLSPLDIEKAGLPPTSEPDSYLQSRLDKFYAELQDWRPGVQQTGGAKPKRAAKDEPEEEVGRVPFDPRADTPVMPSDGTFQGGGGLGFANAGLGFNSAAEEKPADAFDSFREQRSGRYKTSMVKPPPVSYS